MRVIILGSAAGGGVPQWNCGCRNCTEARHTNRSRTQSSVAVSADGERWILLNASPDLRTQLAAHRPLWPPSGSRATPVRAVVLTDGEIDHTLGLLLLRESADRLPVYAPAGVTALLGDEWPLYRVLSAYSGVEPRALEEGRPIALTDRAGTPLGICCSADGARDGPPPDRRPGWQPGGPAATRRETRRARSCQQHQSDPVSRLSGAGASRGGGHRGGRGRDGVRAVSVQLTSTRVDELVGRLRAVLERRYHHLHPFNQRMHRGELSRQELQLWVANRFYYQISIPIKDALILSSCPEREVRQHWIQRIIDHDGRPGEEGGIEAWLRLGEAMGVKREDLVGQRFLLPGVRFAVDAYVNFCRFRPWLEAVAASLTEMFAPLIVKERLAAMLSHYKWVDPAGLQYFKNRLTQAPRDAEYALGLVTQRFRTPEEQERAVAALEFKCDVLWCLLDAVERGDRKSTRLNSSHLVISYAVFCLKK